MKVVLRALCMLPFLSLPAWATSDVTEGQLHEELSLQWGMKYHYLDHDIIQQDVTCDGAKDYVVSRKYFDNPDGPFFQVLLVTNHHPADDRSEMISLGFQGSSEHVGLCVGQDGVRAMTIDVDIEEWSPSELIDIFETTEGICGTAISISDLMCDTNRLFFLTDPVSRDEPRLLFHRY